MFALRPRSRRRRIAGSIAAPWWPLAGFVSLAACDGAPAGDTTIVRDSAGVRLVEHGTESVPVLQWRFSPAPVVTMGTSDVVGDDGLFQVAGAIRFADGAIAVANGGSRELRYYDASGALFATAGGDGEGPGEFRQLARLHPYPGDSAATYDLRLRRTSIFDNTGRFGRSFLFEVTADVPFATVQGVYADGTFLTRGFADTGGAEPAGLQRYPSPYHHFGADGAFLEHIGSHESQESVFVTLTAGAFTVFSLPFGRTTFVRAAGTGLFVAANDTFEYRVFSASGLLETIVRRRVPPAPVPGEAWDRVLDSIVDAASETRRPLIASALRDLERPGSLPAFQSIVVDDGGDVWIEGYRIDASAGSVWTVFAEDGRLRGQLEGPAGVTVYQIGDDFMLGLTKDELDVETVVLYDLIRDAG